MPAQDVTYLSLRKATIHLTRMIPGTPGQPATPGTAKTDSVDCPHDVKRAAWVTPRSSARLSADPRANRLP